MACGLATHRLDGVHWGAGGTGGDREDGGKPRRVEGRRRRCGRHGLLRCVESAQHCRVVVSVAEGRDEDDGGEERAGADAGGQVEGE